MFRGDDQAVYESFDFVTELQAAEKAKQRHATGTWSYRAFSIAFRACRRACISKNICCFSKVMILTFDYDMLKRRALQQFRMCLALTPV